MALSSQLVAQTNPQHHTRHHQYKLYDAGTFGGPNAYGSFQAITLTTAGATGAADTSISDPFYPNCFLDCFISHAFLWRYGHVTDLGALPGNNGGNSSFGFAINKSGLVVGISENGTTDPVTGFPSTSPVAWLYGHIFNLGGFGGTQGAANMVNNRGQIVGYSTNTTPDPYAFNAYFPTTTQMRAFVWEGGRMRDIGTLGGPDAAATTISESGLVIGQSYTSFTPDPDTGSPIADPFLWDGRRMIDLGSLGGVGGVPQWVNNNGQVVGYSFIPSTGRVHAFLWDRGQLNDLGTLYPGSASGAFWINEAGVITGFDAPYAVVWKHGKRTVLGSLPDYDYWATGTSINDNDQVVGYSYNSDYASLGFLWENGDMVDLNALVQPPSDITVTDALQIDNRGLIISNAVDPNGNSRVVVLVPDGDCDWVCEQRIADHQINPPLGRPMNNATTMPRYGKPADRLRRNPFGQPPGVMNPRAVPFH
jgi:probable HAF family extracellular repeat protein